MRLWLKNRMAVCQLVVTCVFSVVCALTDPTGVTVPAVFGSMGTVVVVANLFGLVLAVLYSVGLSRADPDVEYRSSRPVGWWDAALGAIIVLLMIPGVAGQRQPAPHRRARLLGGGHRGDVEYLTASSVTPPPEPGGINASQTRTAVRRGVQ